MPLFELALTGQVLVFLIVIGVFWATGQASIFHPLTTYLLFHGIAFVLRPLLVHYLDFNHEWLYMHLEPTEPQLIQALVISSVGLVVFAASSITFGKSQTKFAAGPLPNCTSNERAALCLTTIILLPLVGYSILRATTGGFQGELVGGTFILTGDSGYTVEAQFMAGPLICAWLTLTRFRWYALLPLIPYVAYRSYAGMARFTFVLLFLAIALVYARQKKIKWPPIWAAACVVPLFILFQAIGANRGAMREFLAGGQFFRVQANEGESAREKFQAKYDGPDFANFDFLTFVTVAVPAKTGTYTYGSQYLQLFTEPIPRKLWPGKPIGAPVGFFDLNNYGNFVCRTPSLVGDGWMSGGWVGRLVTMAIVGAILGWAHRWFWKNMNSNLPALFYLVGLAMLPQWFRDGGISISKFVFWNLSPLVLWSGLAWLLGHRLLPGYSVLLPPGTSLRISQSKNPHGADAATIDLKQA